MIAAWLTAYGLRPLFVSANMVGMQASLMLHYRHRAQLSAPCLLKWVALHPPPASRAGVTSTGSNFTAMREILQLPFAKLSFAKLQASLSRHCPHQEQICKYNHIHYSIHYSRSQVAGLEKQYDDVQNEISEQKVASSKAEVRELQRRIDELQSYVGSSE